jgi:hypothetical protein
MKNVMQCQLVDFAVLVFVSWPKIALPRVL